MSKKKITLIIGGIFIGLPILTAIVSPAEDKEPAKATPVEIPKSIRVQYELNAQKIYPNIVAANGMLRNISDFAGYTQCTYEIELNDGTRYYKVIPSRKLNPQESYSWAENVEVQHIALVAKHGVVCE